MSTCWHWWICAFKVLTTIWIKTITFSLIGGWLKWYWKITSINNQYQHYKFEIPSLIWRIKAIDFKSMFLLYIESTATTRARSGVSVVPGTKVCSLAAENRWRTAVVTECTAGPWWPIARAGCPNSCYCPAPAAKLRWKRCKLPTPCNTYNSVFYILQEHSVLI